MSGRKLDGDFIGCKSRDVDNAIGRQSSLINAKSRAKAIGTDALHLASDEGHQDGVGRRWKQFGEMDDEGRGNKFNALQEQLHGFR